jgi:hypothetical protein
MKIFAPHTIPSAADVNANFAEANRPIRGDQFIQVVDTFNGRTVQLNIAAVLPYIPKFNPAQIQWGYPNADYTSGSTITLVLCDVNGEPLTADESSTQVVQAGWSLASGVKLPAGVPIMPFQKAQDGNFYVCGTMKEIVTNIQYDGSAHKLQKKIKDDWGFFQTNESDWIDIIDFVNCETGE